MNRNLSKTITVMLLLGLLLILAACGGRDEEPEGGEFEAPEGEISGDTNAPELGEDVEPAEGGLRSTSKKPSFLSLFRRFDMVLRATPKSSDILSIPGQHLFSSLAL